MIALSYPADQVRRYDHDRFLTALFAPAPAREHLFALYAFNIEIAKTGEAVSEPLIGQMRLQWWRDALDMFYQGGEMAHQVARPLGAAISAFNLDRNAFDRLIDAREIDLDKVPPADFTALMSYAEGAGAPLAELALRIVGQGALTDTAIEAARLAGTAWALTGLLRAVPFHARQRRLYLPTDRLKAENVRVGRLFDLKPDPGLPGIVREVADTAAANIRNLRDIIRAVPRAQRSPLLLAELATLYLNDLKRAKWNPFILERMRPRPFIAVNLAVRAATKFY